MTVPRELIPYAIDDVSAVDGRDYRRIEWAPTPEAAALIRLLRERARGGVGSQGQGAAETSS